MNSQPTGRTRRRVAALSALAAIVAGGGVAYAEIHTGPAQHYEYVAIDSCRIVDTRSGLGGRSGKLSNGQTIAFRYQGVCGLENSSTIHVTTVNASVTAVQPNGPGFLRIWPATAPEPNATFLNYPNASAGGFNVIGPIRGFGTDSNTNSGISVKQFQVKNYGGPTHIVIDVLGYWDSNPNTN